MGGSRWDLGFGGEGDGRRKEENWKGGREEAARRLNRVSRRVRKLSS